ncbi:MAG TPA: transglutaminase domain-containing protein [Verrucomicrobiae bacterium]|nr:transglutaminase domain-containing protein [Verrucomicrobiae bacterium]
MANAPHLFQFRVPTAQMACLVLFFRLALAAVAVDAPADSGTWWPDSVSSALVQAGTNRQQIVAALNQTPIARREGMQFIAENMPATDLQNLTAAYILQNLNLAYDAFEATPWHDRVPKEIFFNEILPYASVNEKRDDWRKLLREKCALLISDCKSPGEAAQRLNEKLFKLVNVKYSTQRKKADQSPSETMESGLASCTGLSILLIDACRSVGVPARLAGTPMWVNMRGNHTWVEVWDGDWHFTGAAEPDPKGLDHTWFQHDASEALKDNPRHAIYASSFKSTGLAFPMDWAPNATWVAAVNVTDHYTPKAGNVPADKTRLLVKVLDHLAGQRVAAKVTVTDITNSSSHFEGTSRGESADANDILPFELSRGAIYDVRAERDGQKAGREFSTGTNEQAVVVISMSDTPVFALPSQACYAPTAEQPLKTEDETKLKQALTDYFTAPAARRADWKFSSNLERLLRNDEPAVRRIAWEAYQAAPIHESLKHDFDAKQVQFEKYLSPFTLKTVGSRPAKGWALFIAMHGGGNTPKEVNDQQWGVMQHYYRDHPEAGGYAYVALRAPNDTWNGFYDDYVYPLIANLIHEFLLFGDVDPNKVFIMGYSHGGYGAFAIGPKEPDLFAAIHASAAAPTDGETTGKTLRNTIFTCMVGENDTMYGRFDRDKKFRESIKEFRGDHTDIYPVTLQFIPGNGHTGLPDRDIIQEMYPAVRNPIPRDLTWLMTDSVITDFFWLRTADPGKKKEIDATCHDNRVTVTTTTNVTDATVFLDSRLIDFKRPVTLELNGKSMTRKLQPSLRILCETMQRREDPELAFTTEIQLQMVPRQ